MRHYTTSFRAARPLSPDILRSPTPQEIGRWGLRLGMEMRLQTWTCGLGQRRSVTLERRRKMKNKSSTQNFAPRQGAWEAERLRPPERTCNKLVESPLFLHCYCSRFQREKRRSEVERTSKGSFGNCSIKIKVLSGEKSKDYPRCPRPPRTFAPASKMIEQCKLPISPHANSPN